MPGCRVSLFFDVAVINRLQAVSGGGRPRKFTQPNRPSRRRMIGTVMIHRFDHRWRNTERGRHAVRLMRARNNRTKLRGTSVNDPQALLERLLRETAPVGD